MKLKLNPTQQITFVLTLLALGAIVSNNFKTAILIHLLATVGFGFLLFFIFKFFSKQQKNILNTVISCLIIFLICHYTDMMGTSSVISAATITFITIFSKFFLEWKGSPIFNPVVLGLFVLEILTLLIPGFQASFVSWWGASYSLWPGLITFTLILMAIWIVFCFKSWRKWAVAITYLASYFILLLILYKGVEAYSVIDMMKATFLDSTIYFFTFVMLSEPRTSPMLKKHQVIYGLLAAIISIIGTLTNFPTSMLLAILIPNLYFFLTKWFMIRKMQAKQTTPPIIP